MEFFLPLQTALQLCLSGAIIWTIYMLGLWGRRVGALLEQQTELLRSTAVAIVNLEARHCSTHLTGAEAGRLFMCIVAELEPHGPEDTWRPLHAKRQIIELQAKWSRSCRRSGIRPTVVHWNLVVEAGYQRALQDLEPSSWNKYGEEVLLQAKIDFCRRTIPEAVGSPRLLTDLMAAQRDLQVSWEDGAAPWRVDEVLWGDLIAWRNKDLVDWMYNTPGVSPLCSQGLNVLPAATADGATPMVQG